VSTFQGGAIAGTIVNLLAGDRLGRKKAIFAGACVSVLGSALQGGATKMSMLMIGRFIAGMAVGMLTSVIPMYAGELSEAKYRGILSGLLQWMLSWGFLVAQWVGYGCSFATSSVQCKVFHSGIYLKPLCLPDTTRAPPPCSTVCSSSYPRGWDLVSAGISPLAHGKGP
jgi:MFS family permease